MNITNNVYDKGEMSDIEKIFEKEWLDKKSPLSLWFFSFAMKVRFEDIIDDLITDYEKNADLKILLLNIKNMISSYNKLSYINISDVRQEIIKSKRSMVEVTNHESVKLLLKESEKRHMSFDWDIKELKKTLGSMLKTPHAYEKEILECRANISKLTEAKMLDSTQLQRDLQKRKQELISEILISTKTVTGVVNKVAVLEQMLIFVSTKLNTGKKLKMQSKGNDNTNENEEITKTLEEKIKEKNAIIVKLTDELKTKGDNDEVILEKIKYQWLQNTINYLRSKIFKEPFTGELPDLSKKSLDKLFENLIKQNLDDKEAILKSQELKISELVKQNKETSKKYEEETGLLNKFKLTMRQEISNLYDFLEIPVDKRKVISMLEKPLSEVDKGKEKEPEEVERHPTSSSNIKLLDISPFAKWKKRVPESQKANLFSTPTDLEFERILKFDDEPEIFKVNKLKVKTLTQLLLTKSVPFSEAVLEARNVELLINGLNNAVRMATVFMAKLRRDKKTFDNYTRYCLNKIKSDVYKDITKELENIETRIWKPDTPFMLVLNKLMVSQINHQVDIYKSHAKACESEVLRVKAEKEELEEILNGIFEKNKKLEIENKSLISELNETKKLLTKHLNTINYFFKKEKKDKEAQEKEYKEKERQKEDKKKKN